MNPLHKTRTQRNNHLLMNRVPFQWHRPACFAFLTLRSKGLATVLATKETSWKTIEVAPIWAKSTRVSQVTLNFRRNGELCCSSPKIGHAFLLTDTYGSNNAINQIIGIVSIIFPCMVFMLLTFYTNVGFPCFLLSVHIG